MQLLKNVRTKPAAQEPPVTTLDVSECVNLPIQLTAARARLCEAIKLLQIAERAEASDLREVERAQRRVTSGDVWLDPAKSKFYYSQSKKLAEERRLPVLQLTGEVNKIEQSILDNPGILQALEEQLHDQQAQLEQRQEGFANAFVKKLVGANLNGHFQTAQEEVESCKRQIEKIKTAIATASGVIKNHENKQGLKLAKPTILKLLEQRQQHVDAAARLDSEIIKQLKPLSIFPLPPEDWTGIQKRGEGAINILEEMK
jgi:hypothetical protein